MIKTINMRNCASYDEIGITLSNCNKVNYIYGHNGSGKSTISNFLQGVTPEFFRDCSIEWELGTEAEILVYNKNFRLKNLKSMPGVFTLGEATAEQLCQLEELKKHSENLRSELISLQISIKNKKDEKLRLSQRFEKDAWEIVFKKNEAEFSDAFAGLRNSKALFAKKLLEVYIKKPKISESRDSLIERAKVLFGKKPEVLSELTIPNTSILTSIESDDIWNRAIVGNKDVDIASLINMLGNSDWVKTGMLYLEKSNGICPFCQKKTIDESLTDQLNNFFSGEYDRQIKTIERNINDYSSKSSFLINQLFSWISNAKTNSIEYDFESMVALFDSFKLIIEKNQELFNAKSKEPSRRIHPDSTVTVLEQLKSLMATYNNRIIEHNKLASDFVNQKEAIIKEIWALLISENSVLLKSFSESMSNTNKAIQGMQDKEKSLKDEIESIGNQIIDLQKNVTSVQPTVDAINRSLKSYGFDGFRIIASEENPNQYQIMRPNGSIATDTLSEGEETFISFLYFVYMTRGGLDTSTIDKHKVIVIDDPICSLDSSILYVVSSLVRELTSNAKKGTNRIDQVFVLTHNVYFHKEISFLDGRNKTDSKVSYWVLNKKNEITTVRTFDQTNPISTSYALLWKEIKESDSISSVSLQNAMRRILENFFGTLGNSNLGDILNFFESPEEKSICMSLFSWVNDGSHSIPDDLEFCEDNDSKEKFKKVFKDIFYNTHNSYHYDRMME